MKKLITLIAILTFTISFSQDYRFINSYMDDFEKNEMFVKKALLDYSVTFVESQMDSRSKVAEQRIIEKLEKINSILLSTDKGFNNDISLRDSFIKMNKKTISCLINGSLILNDYNYQSTLSLSEIQQNMNRKEADVVDYYQELKRYEKCKITFGAKYNVYFKDNTRNILEYNAYQNFIFYKMNVIDQKLMVIIKARDQKGFDECFTVIEIMMNESIVKTDRFKDDYKDNSMNDANIKYYTFINDQREKLSVLFRNYTTDYDALQLLKNSNIPETNTSINKYNIMVRCYNTNKNLFYITFDEIQTNKKNLYDSWFITNNSFLKRNSKIEDIHNCSRKN